MARWREPRPKSSPYITPEGELALKNELRQLWLLRRQEVVPALRAAAAEGDRSENAEYTYRKKQLGEIDRRVRYLSKRLDELEVVRRTPTSTNKVFFGAIVSVMSEGVSNSGFSVSVDSATSAFGRAAVPSVSVGGAARGSWTRHDITNTTAYRTTYTRWSTRSTRKARIRLRLSCAVASLIEATIPGDATIP